MVYHLFVLTSKIWPSICDLDSAVTLNLLANLARVTVNEIACTLSVMLVELTSGQLVSVGNCRSDCIRWRRTEMPEGNDQGIEKQ